MLLLPLLLLTGCASRHSSIRNEHPTDESARHFYTGTWARMESALEVAREEQRIGAARVVVRRGGARVFSAGYGTTLPDGEGVVAGPDALFDVASLAKPIAGAPMVLLLEQAGVQYLLADDATGPTLRDALRHCTGVVDGQSADEMRPRRGAPYRYANSNYMLIQSAAERHLPDAGRGGVAAIWRTLGLGSATFDATALAAAGAPVVWCAERHGLPRVGHPMDPMADFLRSEGRHPMAHSGLFATADEVALFGDGLLLSRHPDVVRLRGLLLGEAMELARADDDAGEGVARTATILVSPGGMRVATGPPFAPIATPPGRVYYQTGYTGSLLWIDVATATTVAITSNAAATDAHDEWQELARAVVQAVADGTQRGYRWQGN